MNKLLSSIYNKKELWNKFLFYICDAFFSILSIILIPNKFLSVLFIMGILLLDFSALYFSKTKNMKIEHLFNQKFKLLFFISLFVLAVVPSLLGVFLDKANFVELAFSNLIPNLLGGLTVYFMLEHTAKFNYGNFIIKILQTDYIMEIIIKLFYYFCFFNSSNYFLNKTWKYTNIINNTYLFLVILSGLIIGCAFFYRIFIDNQSFDFSPKEVYPSNTLYCGTAYLISCSLPSLFLNVKTEPVLLILNTLTAFIIALALLCYVIRKSDRTSNLYPFMEFGVASLILILNCCIYVIHNVENLGDILHQLSTGGSILTAVIIALCIINKKSKKSDNSKDSQKKQIS